MADQKQGRPKGLVRPTFFRVKFDGNMLDELRDFCQDRMISMNAFIRKAVEKMLKEVK